MCRALSVLVSWQSSQSSNEGLSALEAFAQADAGHLSPLSLHCCDVLTAYPPPSALLNCVHNLAQKICRAQAGLSLGLLTTLHLGNTDEPMDRTDEGLQAPRVIVWFVNNKLLSLGLQADSTLAKL
ncbi:hypothetical protein B0H10DRAFT_1941760 [Mycena sp. CBHHK59/15]|nr:hypothetical protein B0H10DRAFT_1941760 [Mycena sp. CBHHK59/15]